MKKRIIVGIIYLILLAIVIAISLTVFPEWKSSGGFWALFGVAAIAVLAFVEKGVSLWDKSKEDDKEKEEKSPHAPTQTVNSQKADNIYNVFGGTVNPAPQTEEKKEETPKGWHLKHRYALTGNFTGREAEQETLTDWLETKEEPLLILRALGGFGKSALTWHWLLKKVDRTKWTKAIWWSFYEGDASFQNFLDDTLKYLLGEDVELPSVPRLQVEMLLKVLEKDDILLVLDGFERALRAYSSMSAAYQEDDEDKKYDERDLDCVSPAADDFLRGLGSSKGIIQAKVLMTTRLRPRGVEGRTGLLSGCLEKELTELSKEDAVAFFQNQGIKGTRAEIETACVPYGYHPLTLSILAGYILGNRAKPNDVSVAKELDVSEDIIQNKHHVLEVAYNSLSHEEQKLLSTIACFRSPTSYKALQSITGRGDPSSAGDAVEVQSDPSLENRESGLSKTGRPYAELDDHLAQLEQRGLIYWDKTTNKYDLHPIVRRYAYERLSAPDRTAAHTRLKDYFEAVPEKEKIESLNDLAPVIELYHHMVKAGQFDEAYDLFYDRIDKLSYYQFGAYQLQTELLRTIFPDGENKLPRLKKESDQACILNDLAAVYSLNGEPRRAVPLFEKKNEIREKMGDKKNFASGLGNVAQQQLIIGALGDAERNLRRYIELSIELEIEADNSDAYQGLGRLLAYRGLWHDADKALVKGLKLAENIHHIQTQGVITAYRSLRALLMARETENRKEKTEYCQRATESAQRALELADETAKPNSGFVYPVRDYIRAYWLLGASYRASVVSICPSKSIRDYSTTELEILEKAEKHLSESLRRCRAINLVTEEADILLESSKLLHAQGEHEKALSYAQEALTITERSGYVLQGADVNLFLAELALEGIGEKMTSEGVTSEELAREYAEKALQLAHCDDGPPYHYKVAYEEAQALLEKLKE
jgi:tetratricopeptide (TPR) repeat protein